MTDFNEKAGRVNSDEPSLAGYAGFSFGEGQANSSRYMGGLFNRRLQTAFYRGTSAEWKPDCLVYSAHFTLSQNSPSEDMHKEGVLKFFRKTGLTVLKASIEEVVDAEDTGSKIRAVSLQLLMADLEKVRKAVAEIDVECNGFVTRNLKTKAPTHKIF